jgi:outer membrane protein OmpA-like peptidoglycan-associated protein
MPTSSVAVCRLALAMLGLSAASASALGQTAAPADSRRTPAGPVAALTDPPPGPIESRIIAVPVRSAPSVSAPPQTPSGAGSAVIIVVDRRSSSRQSIAAADGTRSEAPMVTITPMPFRAETETAATPPSAAVAALAPDLGPAVPPPIQATLAASVPFIGPSANLTDVTRAYLDGVGADLAKKKPRLIEIRAFATGDDIVSRKIALARALVVRSYLIDRGVKSRMVVGAYPGDGERVDIMVPNT